MKVSVAWIAVGIIVGIILFFTVQGVTLYEQFKNEDSKEGFQGTQGTQGTLDINITTCPADTTSYVDGGGRTVCCDGTVTNGKCSGANICSLSEPIAGLPTCSVWLDAYLENKGARRCPNTMPNYYESGPKAGCTAGSRNATGTAPASTTTRFCTLYNSQEDAMLKKDSCENQKFFDNAKCLSIPTTKTFLDWGGVPPPVHCTGIDTGSLTPLSCIDDSSFARAIDYWAKKYDPRFINWREQCVGWGAMWKMNFCSAVQKVTVNKSMNLSQLESYAIF